MTQHDAHVNDYRIWVTVSSYMEAWKQGALAIVDLWEKAGGLVPARPLPPRRAPRSWAVLDRHYERIGRGK
jgi:ADP-ribose pyrophosphatase YjhB (NUDIX family)